MGYEEYSKARKLGIKAAQNAINAGKSPNLPVLADLVSNIDKLAHIPMGVYEIPLSRVLGTTTQGRTAAFACNFMPLLEPETEFASKWSTLQNSVAEEGIRDAVKAVEYLGDYYLVEGNKRISVAKYLNMEYIDADVTRVMPEKSNEPRVLAYYEYCDFTKQTGLYEPIFETPGQYQKLCKLLRRREGSPWTEDERRDFMALYRYFQVSYRRVMNNLSDALPEEEAFLMFLVAYGYAETCTLPQDAVFEKVDLMKEEFLRMGGEEATNLIMDKEAPYTLIPSIFLPSEVKAAFLYVSPPEDSGWNYWHELGRINAEKLMEGKMETRAVVVPSRNDFAAEVQKLIEEGFKLIFATSPVMLNSCIAPSLEHPDVTFYCCSPVSAYQNVRSYYLRFYEAKFLTGIAAGIYTENGKIGYVADYPIIGVSSAINSFARGAAMVNPSAKILLEWSCKENFNAEEPFADPDIQVISNRDINAPCRSSLKYGLYLKKNGEIRNLAALLPDWSEYYVHFAHQYLKGKLDGDVEQSALSYWWGMSSGGLETVLSSHLDREAARLIQHFQREIREERFNVFEGEWYSQSGEQMCAPGAVLSPAEVLCMEQLASNIVGGFPDLEELNEEGKSVVRLQGRNGELQPDVKTFRW